MPAISKIRLTNVQYEQGNKRYNDELFLFDGHNGAILLENGGGKTVFIQSVIQAMVPNGMLADRKIRDTLDVTGSPAHIAVEWLLDHSPRHYALTCITFYMGKEGLEYLLYAYDYPAGDKGRIELLPFVQKDGSGKRPANRDEIKEYYQKMAAGSMNAKTFATKQEYQQYLEKQFQIVSSEWEAMIKINSSEGDVEKFFDHCKTTGQLVDNLLIPVVEQGMAGNGTKDFAKTFDNQRHQFREYMSLQEQIKEYRQVTEQITRIIERYGALAREEEALLHQKARAKGLFQRVAEEIALAESEQQDLADTEKDLQEREKFHQRKKASLKIAHLQQEQAQLQRELASLGLAKEVKNQEYQECHNQLVSLQFARLQAQLKEKQDHLSYLEWELANLAQAPDIERLNGELNQILAGLRYHYDRQEETIVEQQRLAETQQREFLVRANGLEKELDQSRGELQRARVEEAGLCSGLKHIGEQQEQIQEEILDDPRRETVPQQIPLWQERSDQVAQDLQEMIQQIKTGKESKVQWRRQIQELQQELTTANRNLTQAEERLSAIQRQEKVLLERFYLLSPQDQEIQSLYLRQPTVQHRLGEELARLTVQQEKLLEQERVMLRLYDLYKDNSVFTADPALEKWVQRGQGTFPSLQLGTSFASLYLEEHDQLSMEQLYQHYPLWPVSLVVSQGELEKLQKQLEKQGDHWTHPIFILSEQEARKVAATGESALLRQVTPARWPKISQRENFQAWLEAQSKLAAEVTAERIACTDRKQQWQALADSMRQFWQEYDHQRIYQPLKEEVDQVKGYCQRLRDEIQAREKQYLEQERRLEEAVTRQGNLEQEQNHLAQRLQQGIKWQQLEEKRLHSVNLLEQAGFRCQALAEKMQGQKQEAEGLKQQLERQQERLRDIDRTLITLQAEEEYNRVRPVQGQATAISLELLKEQRYGVAAKLAGWQENRTSLERQIQSLEKEISRLTRESNTHLNQFGENIDQAMVFPPGGDAEIDRLVRLRKEADAALDKAEKGYQSLYTQWVGQGATIATEIQHYQAGFGLASVVDFGQSSLVRVQEELVQEKNSLATEGNLLVQRKRELLNLQQQLEQVKQKLEVAQGIYHYQQDEIEGYALSLKELQEYPYRRREFTDSLIKELELSQERVAEQQKIVEAARKHFEDYCSRDIRDEKTRQQSLNGIRLKTTYPDIKEWGEQLQERIRAATNILEEHLRTLDQQVQHFVAHLHGHLVRICEELLTIPKMTVVKIEERRKQIYDFTVPNWQEQEGKAKLRKHLEWMIQELDKEKYKTDQGFEDEARIKKQIENWLHPKQLLQVIDSSQEIKIRCRKVNSDIHVSTTFTEWPRTEKWSGGEKWSKNMTLFLGILNYLAEKRQHIRRGAGNHRVVIVDNPFGKASSDHVLAPVFFIAKQLGFQIIALTAHAEGKFLKDHFPVIYSCRLRPTKDPSIAVMTKEKEISRALFHDLDPFEIEQLGEEEQLSLFA